MKKDEEIASFERFLREFERERRERVARGERKETRGYNGTNGPILFKDKFAIFLIENSKFAN